MHTAEAQKNRTAGTALKGSASQWLDDYRGLLFTWEQLKDLFIRQYESPTILDRLQAQLYSVRQTDKESVGVFLHKKSALFNKLHPRTPESCLVIALMELIHPGIKQAMRASPPTTFYVLLSRAVKAEHNDKEINRSVPKKESRKLIQKEELPVDTSKFWFCLGHHLHQNCGVYKKKSWQNGIPNRAPILKTGGGQFEVSSMGTTLWD